MVNDDDLADECLRDGGRVVRVTHDLASPNLILRNTPNVEPNVVTRFSFGHSHMVRLDRLQQPFQFLSCFLVTFFSVLDRLIVHLIDGYNQLFNPEGPCEVRMFPRLASRSNSYFELSLLCRNYEYSNVRLASPCNHVLDEVTVSRSIDNRVEVVRSFKLLE